VTRGLVLVHQVCDAVDVALSVDDNRATVVDHHVAAVTQARCLDHLYPHTFTQPFRMGYWRGRGVANCAAVTDPDRVGHDYAIEPAHVQPGTLLPTHRTSRAYARRALGRSPTPDIPHR
jgi:hypothetical protein